MTINSTTRKTNPLVGNGNTATYPFAFKVFQDSEIVVKKLEISTNIETTLTLGANNDYIVTLNSDQNSNPGGSITLRSGGNNQNLATGFQIVITSSLSALQGTDLTNQGGFYPEVINDALDKSVILHQQQEDEIDRSIKFSLTNSINSTEITESATARANKVLSFDSTGEIGLSDAAPKAFLIGATAPTNAPDGSIWYDTVSGRTFVYYVDADSSQWVEANPSFEVGDLSNTNLSNLTNSNIANNAAIAQSKLDLSITNSEVNNSAAIDQSKINLSITNSEVNNSAAIDSSKLSFTQTNSTTARTVDSKFKDFVSAKDFGAVGDGSNDDTAEIQAAINTGKPVYLPKGTYKITDTLVLNQGYRALIGDECMPVIEMHTENKPAIAITEPPSSQDGNKGLNEYSRVENLYIQRKVGGSFNIPNYVAVIQETNAGVVVSGHGSGRSAAVQSTRIRNLRVGNFAVGFYFADCVSVTVHKCFTQNLLNYGVIQATYARTGTTITVTNRFQISGVIQPATVHNIRVGDKVRFTATNSGTKATDAIYTVISVTSDQKQFTIGPDNGSGGDIAEATNGTTCIYSLASYKNASNTQTDLASNMFGVGFYFDATRFGAGEISPLASIELVECDDGRAGDPIGIESVSYLIAGSGDIRDIFFQRCESSHADYGWRINGSATADLNWDVHIIRPIVDAFQTHGIFIENVNGVGALTINGGYFVGKGNYLTPDGTYASANACIKGNSSNGIVVTGGTQILGIGNNASTETDDGVRFDNCNECIVMGNRFSNLQFAISLNGTSYSTIQGNVIGAHATETESTPTLLMAIRLFGNSTRNTIIGNIIKGKDTSGAGQYNQGIKISANGDNENIIVGNAFHPTTVATKIDDSGVGTLKDNNITN